MVHAHATGVAQHRPQHVRPGTITRLRQAGGVPRRLGPVLALLVVRVRRRPDRDVWGEDLAQDGRVRAGGVDAHGEIRDETGAHARVLGAPVRGGELLVAEELQPRVKVRVGRGVEVRAPFGKTLEVLALAAGELTERVGSFPRPVQAVKVAEDMQLRRVDLVAVDAVCRAVALLELCGDVGDVGAGGGIEKRKLRDVFNAQVDGVEEAPGCGQVRGVFHRRARLGGVERVDE